MDTKLAHEWPLICRQPAAKNHSYKGACIINTDTFQTLQHVRQGKSNSLVTRKQESPGSNAKSQVSGDIATLGSTWLKRVLHPVLRASNGQVCLPGSLTSRIGFRVRLPKRKLEYQFFSKVVKAQPFRSSNSNRGKDSSFCECQNRPFPCLAFDEEKKIGYWSPNTIFFLAMTFDAHLMLWYMTWHIMGISLHMTWVTVRQWHTPENAAIWKRNSHQSNE